MQFKKGIQGFVGDERGAELAEYAVGVALLVAIGIVVYQALGDAIVNENSGTATKITSATWTTP